MGKLSSGVGFLVNYTTLILLSLVIFRHTTRLEIQHKEAVEAAYSYLGLESLKLYKQDFTKYLWILFKFPLLLGLFGGKKQLILYIFIYTALIVSSYLAFEGSMEEYTHQHHDKALVMILSAYVYNM